MSATASRTRAAVLAAPLLLLAAACTCTSDPQVGTECLGVAGAQPGRTAACAADADCADHHACHPVKPGATTTCCLFADRACATEADCCPGQTCPAARLRCFDKTVECATDADCGGRGDRFCEDYTDAYGTSRRCRLRACGAGGACPQGQACFQGECVAGLPCGGSCGPGQACVPTLDRCQAYATPPRAGAACPASCAPGFLAAFSDGRNLWDRCALPAVACVCAELPGLPPGDLGRDSALAVEPGQGVHVSTYDARHGDLVVVDFDLDGGRLGQTAVDGVPDAGPSYGPSGYRGGVAEAGPDVGRATSLAAAGGRLYVSYQDVDHRALRVAVRDPLGGWTHHQVDGSGADLGRFTSLAVDASGRPAVAYFQRAAADGADLSACPAPRPPGPARHVTALRLARAASPAPASAADWTVRTLACLQVPAPPCEGCAGVCASPGGVPGCFAPASGCAACGGAQACVGLDAGPGCAPVSTPVALAEVPLGVGLFPSLRFRGDEALVVALRRRPPAAAGGAPTGELVGVAVSAAGVAGPLVVLDQAGDTGWYPDLQVDASGRVGVSYHDATTRSLRFWRAPQLQAGVASELVDRGLTGPGQLASVGTGSGLVLGPGDAALVVYQDATHGDLRLARRGPGGWEVEGPWVSRGAVGFFARAAAAGDRVYASHARLGARVAQGVVSPDDAVLLEVLPR